MTPLRCCLLLAAGCGLASRPVLAQRGDTPGEGPQTPLPAVRHAVPAPPLSPAEEARTFQLPAGFRIELVAGEPLVADPVAGAFDGEGNLWIAEMTRFNAGMVKDVPALARDAKGFPDSAVVKLTSTHHDGHYDRRTVFLDGLNAPRALLIVHDGVIIGDPPRLWFARDTDGDGKCDEKQLLADDYGIDLVNESNANGLLWGRDNVIHNICSNHDFRWRAGKLERLAVPIRGEFGLAQDDAGRLFFNRNSDQLRCDRFPAAYALRNPDLASVPWANERIAASQEVWPSHPTPVVNRGYRRGERGQSNGGLRDDGTLLEFTAACSPLVYRGANFPASCCNNVFVPEPAANLIKRNLLLEAEGRLTAVDAYDRRDFLTSTDPRFRPVALLNCPDGSMLVLDLYRGVLEEYHLDTSYLVEQTAARGLDAPMFGRGRIWRITYEGGPREMRTPDFAPADPAQLAALLQSPNGWWRDAAQQELVERGDARAVPALAALAHDASAPATRLAALWALDGLTATTPALLRAALADPVASVRQAAVRLHERWLRTEDSDTAIRQLRAVLHDPAPEVIVQLALSLGESRSELAVATLGELFLAAGAEPDVPAAIVASLHGREHLLFQRLAEQAATIGPRPEAKALLTLLAAAIVHAGDPTRVAELVARTSDAGRLPSWARRAVIDGLDSLGQASFRRTIVPGRLIQAGVLAPLGQSADPEVKAGALRAANRLARLEQEAKARAKAAHPLSPAEQKLAANGQATFQICAGCHQPAGGGLPNVAPSLVESPWVAGDPEMLVRIVLNGKEGTPGFPGAMPPIGAAFSDEQIAGVLTYVRNSWGLQYGAVAPEIVAKVRQQVGPRVSAWTNDELTQHERELRKAGR